MNDVAAPKRIGIFSGSFDPVHKGHIAFALSAIEAAKLDEVYFAPEARPRRKPSVTHLSHRLAMLRLATRAHPQLKVLELPDRYFLSAVTLPRIKQRFPDDEIFILMGSDHLLHLAQWPQVEYLLKNTGLVVGVRGHGDVADSLERIMNLPIQPRHVHVVESPVPATSSRVIRSQLAAHKSPTDILVSVAKYAKKNWLYESVSDSIA